MLTKTKKKMVKKSNILNFAQQYKTKQSKKTFTPKFNINSFDGRTTILPVMTMAVLCSITKQS